MASFVLVHGAWHGRWCWKAVEDGLQKRRHRVHALDLPAHGDDDRHAETPTLENTIGVIQETVDAETVVVGHSLGAFWAHIACESRRVRGVVYLATLVPIVGSWSATLHAFGATRLLKLPIDRKSRTIPPPADASALLYNKCSPEITSHAIARLRPQPLHPLEKAVVSNAYPPFRRLAVAGAHDVAIPIDAVRRSAEKIGISIVQLASDHSPFFCDPVGLTDLLDDVAASWT